MAVTLNRSGYEFAEKLVEQGRVVYDERGAWSEHQPSADQENEFIREYGFTEYGRWHLGVDDGFADDTKGHYRFPYGDFQDVHRCGVLAAESRAGQYKHYDIERAAAYLHEMIEVVKR